MIHAACNICTHLLFVAKGKITNTVLWYREGDLHGFTSERRTLTKAMRRKQRYSRFILDLCSKTGVRALFFIQAHARAPLQVLRIEPCATSAPAIVCDLRPGERETPSTWTLSSPSTGRSFNVALEPRPRSCLSS